MVLFKANLAGKATVFTAQFIFIAIFIGAASFSYKSGANDQLLPPA